MTVNILGTDYTIYRFDYDVDPVFERDHVIGYCAFHMNKIAICRLKSHPVFENEDEDEELLRRCEKEALRHEILHAFLFESGLDGSSNDTVGAWARNEEMVDWFALQGPKIYKAWMEVDAL